MDLKEKKKRLKEIYALYDDALKGAQTVCKERCAACCTCNVTLTSIEAAFLCDSLTMDQTQELVGALKNNFPEKRFMPKYTTNGFVDILMQNMDAPEEENDPDWGKCPLLEKDLCPVYKGRPFGCRNLVSQVDCRETGYAQIPPLMLTINNLFLQYIEHLDHTGIFGNLSDVLTCLLSADKLDYPVDGCSMDFKKQDSTAPFLTNKKIIALMIPPDHRTMVGKLVEQLSKLCQDA
ncbi:MAG: hypothetical protein GY729_02400 [Desulfobacteraceae bacterium]|nr:hypothetical protein [Desulfobacteraceae bacterium]